MFAHLKAGVTWEQAIADLNSIGADLEKTYPKDDHDMTFSLGRPSLYGDYLGRPMRAFLTGLMLLAGLILLAACTHLGSLLPHAPVTVPGKLLCGSRWVRVACAFCASYLPKRC